MPRRLRILLMVSLAVVSSSRSFATPQELFEADCFESFFDCASVLAISESGNSILVGRNGRSGPVLGEALLFEKDGTGSFVLVESIPAPAGVAGDVFGGGPMAFVDNGDTVLISAWGTRTDSGEQGQGAVYLLERAGAGPFASVQKLVSSNPEKGNYFGMGMALSDTGEVAAIASPWDNVGGTPGGIGYAPSGGSVDIFEREPDGTFGAVQQLTAPEPQSDAEFGTAVALSASGDVLVVGSPGAPGIFSRRGMADVFVRGAGGTFEHVQALYSGDPHNFDDFGEALALSDSGEILLVGVPKQDIFEEDPEDPLDGIRDRGAAEVFLRQPDGTYAFFQKLTAPLAMEFEYFGDALSLSADGKLAVIGAPGPVLGLPSYNGAVHLFTRSATGLFVHEEKLENLGLFSFDQYGVSVATSDSGAFMVAGMGHGDTALVYSFDDTDADGVLDILDNCPADSNPDQLDLDSDDEGDVCDLDRDGDGLLNDAETNDGVFVDANQSGTDPDVVDTDGDGWGDGVEAVLGSDPTDSGSEPPVSVPGVGPLALGIVGALMGVSGTLGLRARRRDRVTRGR